MRVRDPPNCSWQQSSQALQVKAEVAAAVLILFMMQAQLGAGWFPELAEVCADGSALVDSPGFDLAGLDTAIWNDVLDAASVADDFAF